MCLPSGPAPELITQRSCGQPQRGAARRLADNLFTLFHVRKKPLLFFGIGELLGFRRQGEARSPARSVGLSPRRGMGRGFRQLDPRPFQDDALNTVAVVVRPRSSAGLVDAPSCPTGPGGVRGALAARSKAVCLRFRAQDPILGHELTRRPANHVARCHLRGPADRAWNPRVLAALVEPGRFFDVSRIVHNAPQQEPGYATPSGCALKKTCGAPRRGWTGRGFRTLLVRIPRGHRPFGSCPSSPRTPDPLPKTNTRFQPHRGASRTAGTVRDLSA